MSLERKIEVAVYPGDVVYVDAKYSEVLTLWKFVIFNERDPRKTDIR